MGRVFRDFSARYHPQAMGWSSDPIKLLKKDCQSRLSESFIASEGTPTLASVSDVSGSITRPQDSESMKQVEESSETQDFPIIGNNATPDINYSQLLHEEFPTDPELSRKVICRVKQLLERN